MRIARFSMFSMALQCPAVKPECQTGQAYSRTSLTINDRAGFVTGPGTGRSTTGPDRRRYDFWTSFGPLFAFLPEIDRGQDSFIHSYSFNKTHLS